MLTLRRIRVEGFKSLDPIDLKLTSKSVFLIGSNGVGKSSILQCLSFIRAFAEGKSESFFESRGWEARDVISRVRRPPEPDYAVQLRRRFRTRPIRVSLHLCGDGMDLFYEFAWSATSFRTQHEFVFIKRASGAVDSLLSFAAGNVQGADEVEQLNLELSLPGSILEYVKPTNISRDAGDVEAVRALREWCAGITSLELLSPIAMRKGARGKQKDIGPRGEFLAGFLASISSDKRDRIVARLQRFYPLHDVDTTKKRAGWVDMQIAERYSLLSKTGPSHMSDGFFRLLAMCSIPEFEQSSSLILLDEVEDGIEPHILPLLIKQIDAEVDGQLIMTSHSPLLINQFDIDQVRVIARDSFGRTVTARPEQLETFQDSKDYFGSGEIWINADRDRFYDEVREVGYPTNDLFSNPASNIEVRASAFLGE